MNIPKDISSQQQYENSLPKSKQVEYKQKGQRYSVIKTESAKSELRKLNGQQHLEAVKADIEGSLMKFDEESHINFSDSEKETQITQTAYQADLEEKLNFGGQNSGLPNQNQHNPNIRYQAFEKGINTISQYQQQQLREIPERHFKQQQQQLSQHTEIQQITNENSLQGGGILAQQKKNVNIFSDQKKMNQQILNETLEKKNKASLTEINSHFQRDEMSQDQKSTKSQGTIHVKEDIQNDVQNSKKPYSYIEYYKQMQQNHHISKQNDSQGVALETTPQSQSSNSYLNHPNTPVQSKQYTFTKSYKQSLNKESIPFSNASTILPPQNNSEFYQNSPQTSLNTTPMSKTTPARSEIYPKIKQSSAEDNNSTSLLLNLNNQRQKRGSGIQLTNNANDKNYQSSQLGNSSSIGTNFLSVESINQGSRTNEYIRRNIKQNSLLEVKKEVTVTTSISDSNIKLPNELIKSQIEENDLHEDHHEGFNENVNTNESNSVNKSRKLPIQMNKNGKSSFEKEDEEDEEEDQANFIIPLESMNEDLEEMQVDIDGRRKNSKKFHHLNEASQFKNAEGINSKIIISNENLSPQVPKIQEPATSTPNASKNRRPFQFQRKRVLRQNLQPHQLQQEQEQDNIAAIRDGENKLGINEDGQTYESNDIQLIQLSQDSLYDSQNQNNQQKTQQNEDQKERKNESPFKLKIPISSIVTQNINKFTHELQRDLSGSKQLQFEQVEKKVVQDLAINDNSFSDDSPLPFPQNTVQQNVQQNGNGKFPIFQNASSHKKAQQQKLNLQQFQTQIMSDSNESESDEHTPNKTSKNPSDSEEQKEQQMAQNDEQKPRHCSIDGQALHFQAISQKQKNQPQIYINKLQKSQNECNDSTQNGQNFVRYQKENNLIIFSNQLIDGNSEHAMQSNQQLDDYNNLEIQPNELVSACKEIEDGSSAPHSENFNSIKKSNNNSIQSGNHKLHRDSKDSPILRSQLGSQSKPNIIHFETEEELDNIEGGVSQSTDKGIDHLDGYDLQQQQLDKQTKSEIVSEFSLQIPAKSKRFQRIKAFSQNNTPHNSTENTLHPDCRNSAESSLNKFKSRPSAFLSKLSQFKDHQEDFSSMNNKSNTCSDVLNLPTQNKPEITIPIFFIPQQVDGHEQQENQIKPLIQIHKAVSTNNNKDKDDQEKLSENALTLSGDDVEDFDDEEDEDDDELDEEEEEVEVENLNIFHSIKKRASNSQQKEDIQNCIQEMLTKQREQTRYNQREIGIGKYFCEKLFNVYGDTKLFQKKKRKLKKWRKMIQIAEDSLIRKSQQMSNYDYSSLENKGMMNAPNFIVPQQSQLNSPIIGALPYVQDSNSNSQQQQQQQQNQFQQDNLQNMNQGSSSYTERIKVYQQKLLDSNKKVIAHTSSVKKGQVLDTQNSHQQQEIEGDQISRCPNEDIFTAEEEFELMYYFKRIKRNDFQKALRKGPPMWYRWSAWKVSLDLNVDDYRPIYDKLKPTKPLKPDEQPTNPIDKQIHKDIHRTMPCEPFFSDPRYCGQSLESLRNVLKAVSLYFDNVGYCQGMNFLGAYLLLINGGDELQTFAMFIQMDKRFNIMGLFEEEFPLIQFMNFVFQREFGRKFPKLCRHFNKEKIPETMWVVQWFQTLFLNSLPLNVVCRFWDYIFYSGCILSVISISLSLIHEYSAHLIKMDINEMSQFTQKLKQCSVLKGEMRNSPCKPKPLLSPLIHLLQKDQLVLEDNIIVDPEKIIKRAQTYEIPKKEILSYINEFKQINFLYKDKPFLSNLENALHSNSQDYMINILPKYHSSPIITKRELKQQTNSHFATPKKFQQTFNTSDEKESEFQSLLHPKSCLENKKSGFSLFGFSSSMNDKKNYKNM